MFLDGSIALIESSTLRTSVAVELSMEHCFVTAFTAASTATAAAFLSGFTTKLGFASPGQSSSEAPLQLAHLAIAASAAAGQFLAFESNGSNPELFMREFFQFVVFIVMIEAFAESVAG